MKEKFLIDDIAARHTGLTNAIGSVYEEAARVCLDRHFASPKIFHVAGLGCEKRLQAEWTATDARTKAAWANEIDATESGAYCLALAAVEQTEGLVALSRAETHTGADYYVGPAGQDVDDLESLHRLEVSGTDRGDENAVAQRLRRKVEQAKAGSSDLPALAAVVGFRALCILIDRADR